MIEKFLLLLTIPLIMLTCNVFADNESYEKIEELHESTKILVTQERYNEALTVFDQILEIDPNNVKALLNRGAVLITIGKNEMGIMDTNKVLAVEPNNIRALTNKAIALSHIGYNYDAIATFEKAIKLDPNNNALKERRNYMFKHIDLLEISTQEKYDVYVHAQVRTQNGELVSVIEAVSTEFLPSDLTDQYLKQFPIIKIVEKNGKNYEMRQIVHKTDEWSQQTYGHLQLKGMCNSEGTCVNVFAGRMPSIFVDNGNEMVVQWTVYRIVE